MPVDKINGVKLFWELSGNKGEPLVLVHGSWVDHHTWDLVTAELSKTFRVLTYDRRGHSESARPSGQGSIEEDIADLGELIMHLNLSPAHIAGNSFGACIVLNTAAKRPDIFRSMIIHEPPMIGLLKDDPAAKEILQAVKGRMKTVVDMIAAGNMQKAAEEFVEKIAMGPGEWKKLPEAAQKTFIYNAPTWYDEMQDSQSLEIDITMLSDFKKPASISLGTASPPFFPLIIDKLTLAIPRAKRTTIEGAGHVPHMSHPEKYIELVRNFCLSIGK
jgi:pimeloyl-ACP methyl ester carboxylesterase